MGKFSFGEPSIDFGGSQDEGRVDSFFSYKNKPQKTCNGAPIPNTVRDLENFIYAGRAVFTLVNNVTGVRITYKVKAKDEHCTFFFVAVLVGPDNYVNMGIIRMDKNYKGVFKNSAKSTINETSNSSKGIIWVLNKLNKGLELPAPMELHHAGRCGKCGKELTDPESIKVGLGPVCRSK